MNRALGDQFRETVWEYYHHNQRVMPWRQDTRPYYVLVSELMLQQTQVSRVIPKFEEFIKKFPDVSTLASSSLGDVLIAWSGLGYNRRAKFLHQAAQQCVAVHQGAIPTSFDELLALPGVGKNTASAILAYAQNQPVSFIETNIRTVYIHHFFDSQLAVSDSEILELVRATVDTEHPREWYWALMDYGSYLKRSGSGRLDQSKVYKKQPPLAGSIRQVRGLLVAELTTHGPCDEQELASRYKDDERYKPALEGLIKDGLLHRTSERIYLTGHERQ